MRFVGSCLEFLIFRQQIGLRVAFVFRGNAAKPGKDAISGVLERSGGGGFLQKFSSGGLFTL